MRIIVTGGRDYKATDTILEVLREYTHFTPTLVHGGAPGADSEARYVAAYILDWATEEFPADWSQGRKAGPIRNQAMVDAGADLVIAFAGGGRGTADMVRRAKAAGIPVREVQP